MPPLDSMKLIAGWSTFMAVVMWALCVLLSLACLICMSSSWPVGRSAGYTALGTTTDLKISNKSKANMRLNALLLLLRGVMGEDHLSPPGIREQPGQQGSPHRRSKGSVNGLSRQRCYLPNLLTWVQDPPHDRGVELTLNVVL